MEAAKGLTGIPHPETLVSLVRRFGLVAQASRRTKELGMHDPVEFLVDCDLRNYQELTSDPRTLRDVQSAHAIAVLRRARERGFKTGLATMATSDQTNATLDALGLSREFDCVATLEVVKRGKPDPEVYLYVARQLEVEPTECLVFEDTDAGVRGALAAGAYCIALPTEFTRAPFDRAAALDRRWIVYDPLELATVVDRMVAEVNGERSAWSAMC